MLLAVIRKLKHDNYQLKTEITKLSKRRPCSAVIVRHQKMTSDNSLLTDKDVKFYTGLKSKKAFNDLLAIIAQYVTRRWRGKKAEHKTVKKVKAVQISTRRKLFAKDEFLLCLMRFRLGLLEQHLANLFGVSCALVSQIFNTWLTAMDKV